MATNVEYHRMALRRAKHARLRDRKRVRRQKIRDTNSQGKFIGKLWDEALARLVMNGPRQDWLVFGEYLTPPKRPKREEA